MTALDRLVAAAAAAGHEPGASVRVGIDTVPVDEVAASLATFGDRYVRRLFTPHEAACSGWPATPAGPAPGRTAEMLAARFAAKEAALKVLRPEGPRPAWRTIEVRRDPGGWSTLALHGSAARLARRAGLRDLAVSLTHDGGSAAAVVVGVCNGGAPRTEEVA